MEILESLEKIIDSVPVMTAILSGVVYSITTCYLIDRNQKKHDNKLISDTLRNRNYK